MRAARVATWAILASIVLASGAGIVLWERGYRIYAVRTGSMAPTYGTGALVIDQPVDESSSPGLGEVITFRTGSGVVTHRVHARIGAGLVTKGDANRSADPWTLPKHDVIGEVVAGIANGGYVLVFLKQPSGVPSLVLLTVSVLLAWQIFFDPTDTPPKNGRRRFRRSPPPQAVLCIAMLALIASVAGTSGAIRSTGAWFSDTTSGTMSFEFGCDDIHDRGNGPVNGNGHDKCHGQGHTAKRSAITTGSATDSQPAPAAGPTIEP